jgi:GT2 family glycosyltransferase
MIKYSIIIPTYQHLDDLLKPCLDSVIKYTTLNDDIEILVVANGCVDGTTDYVHNLNEQYPSIKLLNYKEGLGYTKATNEGIKAAKGEYIVLLNNDCILLEQPKDLWLSMLVKPFIEHSKAGVTGPLKLYCNQTEQTFLVFFCVMIRATLFDELGLLDEVFSPGSGEDIDFCIRTQNAGYDIIRVPEEDISVSHFPIYHLAEGTFKHIPEYTQIFERNSHILSDRYKRRLS